MTARQGAEMPQPRCSSGRVSPWALHSAGVLCAVAYGYLTVRSQDYAEATLTDLFIVMGCCAFLTFVTYARYRTASSFPTRGMLLWALVFRGLGVSAFPVLEDDIFRYLWDGRMLVETGTPYGTIPADHFADTNLPEAFESILNHVNYPTIGTVYGPVCQWIFGVAYLIAPGAIWPLQVIFALCDGLMIRLLLSLAPPSQVLLYAWSPLVIKEFAFTAHADVLGIVLLLAALLSWQRQRFLIMAGLLGLAVGAKVFAVVLAPVLLMTRWRAWVAFVVALVAIHAPFAGSLTPEGLVAMGQHWQFNASLYRLLVLALTPLATKACLTLVFGGVWAWYVWRVTQDKTQPLPRGDWLFGALLLCSPVVNPWYVVWILPFAVCYPTYWAWTASVAVLFSYIIGLDLSDTTLAAYEQPLVWVIGEYGLVAIAAWYDRRRGKR